MAEYRAVLDPDSTGVLVQRRYWWWPFWTTFYEGYSIWGISLSRPRVFSDRQSALDFITKKLSPPLFSAGSIFGRGG